MLNSIIRVSLQNRLLVLGLALFLLCYGTWQGSQLPIDVFPDLNRPRVVILTEAHGLAPEEVETLVTLPLETALNGANGVQAVRSNSGVGLSVIYVEFDWDTDIYTDRQIVNERIALARDRLPPGIQPQLTPISSIMGQIVIVGMYTDNIETSPMELRTLADWVVRQRLLKIPGVSQVVTMGGERKQFQVLVDPNRLQRFDVTLGEVKTALEESNRNSAGGYLDENGPNEYLVRSLGRITELSQLSRIPVAHRDGQTVWLSQVARIVEGPQVKRGDSAAFRQEENGKVVGGAAVALTINKQPDADTREVTVAIEEALDELKGTLPADVHVLDDLYQQKSFIDLAISNVQEALRDGSLLVVIILLVFLMSIRTTLITLTAIPLSIVMTAIVFFAFGLSINTMSLGGLAVAIGELVDDAIVDVENIFRRLRENRRRENPRNALVVVYQASCEIRNSIVYGTMIVVLVFIPLFALSGMEGRLFAPMGIAYIVSILCSLLVSMTVTPVLSYWLLSRSRLSVVEHDSLVLTGLKWISKLVMRASLRFSWPILIVTPLVVLIAVLSLLRLERDFLPPFDEGSVQINVLMPPGTSLAKSNEVGKQVERRLMNMEDVTALVRKTGRAELDEHAVGVHVSEIIATINPETEQSRSDLIKEIEKALEDIPGIVVSVEQPLAHLISHMLSGVKAQIAIKLYGDDLSILRREANEIKLAIEDVPGVRDLHVEQQVEIPQLRIEADEKQLAVYGLRREQINRFVETAMQGQEISQVLEDQRTFDLVLRLDEEYREDIESLKRMVIDLPEGGSVKLDDVARVYRSSGPNTINREQVRRRITVECNVSDRGLVDVVEDIKSRVDPIQRDLPTGYFVEYGGQFESQQSASRMISILFLVSLVGMFLLLYKMFGSVNLSMQVMVSLPMAFIGSVAALYVTGQTLTIAAMVGFISLCGIASRNGILLINYYLHLLKHEGASWSKDLVIRAGQDRLAPVLMTALTSGIGLVPLALAAGEPGKEILYPVATVIIGGLITSTLLEYMVRPVLFWTFGRRASLRIIAKRSEEAVLFDPEPIARVDEDSVRS